MLEYFLLINIAKPNQLGLMLFSTFKKLIWLQNFLWELIFFIILFLLNSLFSLNVFFLLNWFNAIAAWISVGLRLYPEFINKNLDSLDKKYSLKEDLLELKPLILRVNTFILNKKLDKENFYTRKKNLFEKIFSKLLTLYPQKDIYVVYLPETSCFDLRENDCKKRFEILNSSSNKINFLNFYKHIKENTLDYKTLYALEQDGVHFSPDGYKKLINFIIKKIN